MTETELLKKANDSLISDQKIFEAFEEYLANNSDLKKIAQMGRTLRKIRPNIKKNANKFI